MRHRERSWPSTEEGGVLLCEAVWGVVLLSKWMQPSSFMGSFFYYDWNESLDQLVPSPKASRNLWLAHQSQHGRKRRITSASLLIILTRRFLKASLLFYPTTQQQHMHVRWRASRTVVRSSFACRDEGRMRSRAQENGEKCDQMSPSYVSYSNGPYGPPPKPKQNLQPLLEKTRVRCRNRYSAQKLHLRPELF